MQLRNRLLLLATLLTVGIFTTLHAQDDKSKRPSPLVEAKATVGDVNVSIVYGSPAVKGRKIWGALVPYGEVWRTGANEATTFEVSKDVEIEGQKLPAGKYALFTIPGEKEWTIIFNKEASQWGAYNYKKDQDALRVTVKADKAKPANERMTFKIDEKSGKVTLLWENVAVPFTVKAAKA
ncbi:MAG: DUF2911 domain-containing protein [Saprospiraceae bacterium]